jgi:uncharacterized protein YdhG (YjbR/CyaY superfamily)
MSTSPIDKYLTDVPEDFRIALEKLRHTILQSAPKGTEEIISYGIPIFKWNGMLVGFAAYKKHCSFFACSSTALKKVKNDIKDFKGTLSAIHFTPEKPLSPALVKKIVKIRIEETKAKLEKKEKTKSAKKKAAKKKK